MNSVWRRQLLFTIQQHHEDQEDKSKQNLYLEQLTRYLKTIKKREDLYFRLCDIDKRAQDKIDLHIHMGMIQRELDRTRAEQQSFVKQFQMQSTAPYMNCKTAIYSFYTRVMEILEMTRQRLRMLVLDSACNCIENQKRLMNEIYNGQMYAREFKVFELITHASKITDDRVRKQIAEMHRKLSAQTKQITKRSLSEIKIHKPPIPNFLDILTMRKIKTRQEEEQRKTEKKKPKKDKCFTKLYVSVLEVQNIYKEENYLESANSQEFYAKIYDDTCERNQNLKSMIDKYQRQYDQFKKRAYRIRNKRKQSTQQSNTNIFLS